MKNKTGHGLVMLERFGNISKGFYISLSSSNSYPFEHVKFRQEVKWLGGSIFRSVKNDYISNPNLIQYENAILCDLAIQKAKVRLEKAGYDVMIIDFESRKLSKCMHDAWRTVDFFDLPQYDMQNWPPVQQCKSIKELVLFVVDHFQQAEKAKTLRDVSVNRYITFLETWEYTK